MSSERTQRSHREMYKARTPPWKETYRKRCFERLKDSREKLKDRFRKLHIEELDKEATDSFIEELMKEELKRLRQEHMTESGDVDIEMESGSNIDEILTMFDDIQDELRKEELRMLEEFAKYEHSLELEQQRLCNAIDTLTAEEVICPLCQKNPLHINMSVIFCKCGLRINTEQDCLTLANVRQMLEQGVQEHSKNCDYKPCFSLMSELGTGNLLMTCQECDWMSVVI